MKKRKRQYRHVVFYKIIAAFFVSRNRESRVRVIEYNIIHDNYSKSAPFSLAQEL
jgi:hypothetical protein